MTKRGRYARIEARYHGETPREARRMVPLNGKLLISRKSMDRYNRKAIKRVKDKSFKTADEARIMYVQGGYALVVRKIDGFDSYVGWE